MEHLFYFDKYFLVFRTDAGVHAIHTTMHVDLETYESTCYSPKVITGRLNQYFNKNNIPIRILKTYLVPNNFKCRHNAIARTYLYRLGVVYAEQPMSKLHIPI